MPDRWTPWPRYEESRPRPVEGGLAARSQRGAIGDTWWSQRFIQVLERYGVGGRMQRGRRYARAGQVVALTVDAGRVDAVVQGSRVEPYRCRLAPVPLTDTEWDAVIDELAARAAYAARLLAGEMPADIEDVFTAAGVPLFPHAWADVRAACSCPDWENPCKHLAAVLYLLAEHFDADPFLVLAWRGRDREALLAGLRARRRGTDPVLHDHPPAPAPERPAPWWPDGIPASAPAVFWGVPVAPVGGDPTTARGVTTSGLRRLPPLDRRAFNRPVHELLEPAFERFC